MLKLPQSFPHGGGVEAAARAWGCAPGDVLDLSTGLHPAGPPAWLGDWLKEHAALAGRYPDASGMPARGAVADAFSVRAEQVLMAAGAQAVIEVIVQAMGWRSLAIRTPCYTEPIRCALRAGCALRSFSGVEVPVADVAWITSPANPQGDVVALPGGRAVVLDESYMPFARRRRLGVMPGVIRIGSLTKIFAIPGLRLGYVIAEEGTVRRLRRWLPPWPVGTLALHLVPALLPEADARDAALAQARQRMYRLLARCGWDSMPSEASFVLARPRRGPLPDFAAARILVRAFPEWPELAGWVRLGFPDAEDGWQRLERALCR